MKQALLVVTVCCQLRRVKKRDWLTRATRRGLGGASSGRPGVLATFLRGLPMLNGCRLPTQARNLDFDTLFFSLKRGFEGESSPSLSHCSCPL